MIQNFSKLLFIFCFSIASEHKLIEGFYGFTKGTIISEEIFGVISPRYYVTIQFE